jgi:predicted TIM-barrel fold metal-dependent hydrolase
MQTLEVPFETTRTIVSLITSGTTTRFPDIRWIFAHNGGATPMLIGRIEEMDHRPIGKNFPKGMRRELAKLYYDTASAWNDGAMQALLAIAPPSHVMFGSDYPFLGTVEATSKWSKVTLPRALRAQMDRDNALKLFPRLKKLGL